MCNIIKKKLIVRQNKKNIKLLNIYFSLFVNYSSFRFYLKYCLQKKKKIVRKIYYNESSFIIYKICVMYKYIIYVCILLCAIPT